ncbi:uroporphyrinogen-III synthase [Ruegeria sediminis]|uniref:Uroporphyrinogen-III synthase n=1 Tax=Ruegeria sediminis TaxID=2583820 RepID=A0ABY2WY98_9RHOB|nr:uroporphyrinogen-III synthase [Ruegeria sediminis]TMV07234.1 uroporphyrinogen-III synthase [Ruegeria sediminis]
MTRPRAASERFVAQLPPKLRGRMRVVHSPLLDIRPIERKIDVSGLRGLIFTSANGVSAAAPLMRNRSLPAYCVGEATTAAAEKAGWTAQMAGETAEELIATLLHQRPGSPLLHLRGEHSRGHLAERLTQLGLTVRDQAIYRQRLLPFSKEARAVMSGHLPVIAPVFSPRTARQFADLWTGQAPLWLAAISKAAAEPLDSLDFRRLKVAKRPNSEKMRLAVKKLAKHAMRVEGVGDAD